MTTLLWQPQLPDSYHALSDEALKSQILAAKQKLGSDLVILGHHYQQDQVIQFADFTGDSFKLSQLAAQEVQKNNAKYVIFQGVHFMAESADILTPESVSVILPDLGAGCSMADMADYDMTIDAWNQITAVIDTNQTRLIPICYMNCTAAIKAFCGEHGGAVCTSSNADAIIAWALQGGDTPLLPNQKVKILFIPDQHLGRNTAAKAGFNTDTDMAIWDPQSHQPLAGLNPETINRVTFLLWKGHCSVHKLFRPEHIDQIRQEYPNITVIAHPECSYQVCQKADSTGSTEGIINAIRNAKQGDQFAIATEVHLVNRLKIQAEKRGVFVRMLSSCQCLCTTMYRIDLPHMLYILDNLLQGKVQNQITVHPTAKAQALLSLNRMLDITAAASKA